MVKICYYRKRKRIPYHIVDTEEGHGPWNTYIAQIIAGLNRPVDWRDGDRVTIRPWIDGKEYTYRVENAAHEFGLTTYR